MPGAGPAFNADDDGGSGKAGGVEQQGDLGRMQRFLSIKVPTVNASAEDGRRGKAGAVGQGDRAQGPSERSRTPTAGGAQLLQTFASLWSAQYGRPCQRFSDKDRRLADGVAGEIAAAEWSAYISSFLDDERDFYVRRRHPFRVLAEDIDQHAPPRRNRIMSEQETEDYLAEDRREQARVAALTPEQRKAEHRAVQRAWRSMTVAFYVEVGQPLPLEYVTRPGYREAYDALLAERGSACGG